MFSSMRVQIRDIKVNDVLVKGGKPVWVRAIALDPSPGSKEKVDMIALRLSNGITIIDTVDASDVYDILRHA